MRLLNLIVGLVAVVGAAGLTAGAFAAASPLLALPMAAGAAASAGTAGRLLAVALVGDDRDQWAG